MIDPADNTINTPWSWEQDDDDESYKDGDDKFDTGIDDVMAVDGDGIITGVEPPPPNPQPVPNDVNLEDNSELPEHNNNNRANLDNDQIEDVDYGLASQECWRSRRTCWSHRSAKRSRCSHRSARTRCSHRVTNNDKPDAFTGVPRGDDEAFTGVPGGNDERMLVAQEVTEVPIQPKRMTQVMVEDAPDDEDDFEDDVEQEINDGYRERSQDGWEVKWYVDVSFAVHKEPHKRMRHPRKRIIQGNHRRNKKLNTQSSTESELDDGSDPGDTICHVPSRI